MFWSRMLLLVVLLSQLFMGCLTGKGVLCIEPDGKIALEVAGRLCCDDTLDELSPVDGVTFDVLVPGARAADCCSCIDIPLPGGDTEPVVVTDAVPAPDRLKHDGPSPALAMQPTSAPTGLWGTGDARAVPPRPTLAFSRAPAAPLFLRC